MTSKPPSPSDGSPLPTDGSSLPSRHRPNLGNLTRETTEKNLWGFDEEMNLPEVPVDDIAPTDSSIPAPRTHEATKTRQIDVGNSTVTGPRKKTYSASNITRIKAKPELRPSLGPKPTDDFDELDHWEQEDDGPKTIEKPVIQGSAPEPVESTQEIEKSPDSPEIADSTPDIKIELATPKNSEATAVVDDDTNEFSPPVRPSSTAKPLKLSLGLSKIERLGLFVLLVLLLLGGIGTVMISLNRLPTENVRVKANDFPIKGQHLSIASAESYWREPVLNGDHPDVVRRGTVLIPAISLKTAEGTGALRIVFRNQDGDSVGDIITRSVKPGEKLEINATAGFDDLGMHAAYRTGETKPWVIGVYEGPSEDAAPDSFKKLFEMNISTDRR